MSQVHIAAAEAAHQVSDDLKAAIAEALARTVADDAVMFVLGLVVGLVGCWLVRRA